MHAPIFWPFAGNQTCRITGDWLLIKLCLLRTTNIPNEELDKKNYFPFSRNDYSLNRFCINPRCDFTTFPGDLYLLFPRIVIVTSDNPVKYSRGKNNKIMNSFSILSGVNKCASRNNDRFGLLKFDSHKKEKAKGCWHILWISLFIGAKKSSLQDFFFFLVCPNKTTIPCVTCDPHLKLFCVFNLGA